METPLPEPRAGASTLAERLAGWEARLETLADWVNPILVKETRQALKSQAFSIPFLLLLLCGWIWSLGGLSLPGAAYANSGGYMLAGYLWILAFPLLVIVPMTAFRSLGGELEDGTLELVSVTTLQARQIVTGKLGSAALQTLLYASALAPCIAFTYLLRGVDILTIVLVLAYLLLGSLFLSSAGLMLAGVSRQRHWQLVLTVLLVLGLFGAYVSSSGAATGFILEGLRAIEDPVFPWLAAAPLLVMGSCTVLFTLAAASRIGFASDNRSSPLRGVMLAQQGLLTGLAVWMLLAGAPSEAAASLFTAGAAVYWYLIGMLINGEQAFLSRRVLRGLPQSYLGRALFTCFNPGPGTGYLFVTTNLFGGSAVLLLSAVLIDEFTEESVDVGEMAKWLALLNCYLVLYLGVGNLLMRLLHHQARGEFVLTIFLHGLLALLGPLLPAIFQLSLSDFLGDEYTLLQLPNYLWTLAELDRNRGWTAPILLLLAVPAGAMWLLHFVLALRPMNYLRQATPWRVLRELEASRPAKPVVPRSPWDSPEEPPAADDGAAAGTDDRESPSPASPPLE